MRRLCQLTALALLASAISCSTTPRETAKSNTPAPHTAHPPATVPPISATAPHPVKTAETRGPAVGTGAVSIEQGKEIVVQTLTLAPGGSTGWHAHPGDVFFIVKSGTLTTYGLDGPP